MVSLDGNDCDLSALALTCLHMGSRATEDPHSLRREPTYRLKWIESVTQRLVRLQLKTQATESSVFRVHTRKRKLKTAAVIKDRVFLRAACPTTV